MTRQSWSRATRGNVSLSSPEVLDFGAQPVELELRFYNHRVEGWWYAGSSLWLRPLHGDDYLHVRVDNGSQIRLENRETAATGFQKAILPYQPLAANTWHTLKLRLDRTTDWLEVDGKLLGEGPHDLAFTQGKLALSQWSGHLGHGDVWKIDYLRLRPAP